MKPKKGKSIARAIYRKAENEYWKATGPNYRRVLVVSHKDPDMTSVHYIRFCLMDARRGEVIRKVEFEKVLKKALSEIRRV